MSTLPQRAEVVVIGAGIVGNSLVYHLAKLGWQNIVLLDKGPLPNPGGSTGHASNFIFPVDHSKEMTLLTLDSIKQFDHLGVFTKSGGIELARTEERMQELTRRLSSAKAWGVPAELMTSKQVKERLPYVNTDIILGGFFSPTAGVVDPLHAGRAAADPPTSRTRSHPFRLRPTQQPTGPQDTDPAWIRPAAPND